MLVCWWMVLGILFPLVGLRDVPPQFDELGDPASAVVHDAVTAE